MNMMAHVRHWDSPYCGGVRMNNDDARTADDLDVLRRGGKRRLNMYGTLLSSLRRGGWPAGGGCFGNETSHPGDSAKKDRSWFNHDRSASPYSRPYVSSGRPPWGTGRPAAPVPGQPPAPVPGRLHSWPSAACGTALPCPLPPGRSSPTPQPFPRQP
jgi:hypothetical protein